MLDMGISVGATQDVIPHDSTGKRLITHIGDELIIGPAAPISRLLASIDVTLSNRPTQRTINRIRLTYQVFEWPRTSPRATLHSPAFYSDGGSSYAFTYIGFNERVAAGSAVIPYLGQIRIRGNVPEASRPNEMRVGTTIYPADSVFFSNTLGTVVNFTSGPVIWRGQLFAPQTVRLRFDLYRTG